MIKLFQKATKRETIVIIRVKGTSNPKVLKRVGRVRGWVWWTTIRDEQPKYKDIPTCYRCGCRHARKCIIG